MRMAFGLVALLVMVAIMALIFRTIEAPEIETGQKVKEQAVQISGRGADGGDAMSSFQTEAKMRGSNLDALTVKSVRPGGAMADFYGLQPGDEILSVDGIRVGDISNNDPATAKAMVVQKGFQGSLPIVVRRNGVELNLPADKNATAATAPGSPAAPPASPATPNTVQNQLKNLGIQTH